MKLKVTYNTETHRISKVPDTLQSLTALISEIFLCPLPSTWGLEYHDLNGNKVTLSDEKEYKELITTKFTSTAPIVRVIIVPRELLEKVQVPSLIVVDDEVSPVAEVIQEKEVKIQDDLVQFAPLLSHEDFKYTFIDHWNQGEQQESNKHPNQDFEDLIDKAIEKRIPKIVSMTQEYISENSYKQRTETHIDPQERSTSHMGITCCGCLTTPISGIRYKCSICPNFDFCELCEDTKDHPHALIKIKSPEQPFLHVMSRLPPPPPPFMPFMHHPPQFMPPPPPFMSHPPIFMFPPHPGMQPPSQAQGRPNPFMQGQSYPNPCGMNQKFFPEQIIGDSKPCFEEMCESPSMLGFNGSQSSDDVKKPAVNMGASSSARSFFEKVNQSRTVDKSKKEKVPSRKSYCKATLKKARSILQMMPNVDYDALLKFVEESRKDMDILELAVAFDLTGIPDKC